MDHIREGPSRLKYALTHCTTSRCNNSGSGPLPASARAVSNKSFRAMRSRSGATDSVRAAVEYPLRADASASLSWPPMVRSSSRVQHHSHGLRQFCRGKRFLKKRGARIQEASSNHVLIRVAGHEEHTEIRTLPT